jgi:hypothetical protein
MAFFSAEVKEQYGQGALADMERMKSELQTMKDTTRIRARYGQHITDEQITVYLAEEKDMIIRKAKAEEREKTNRQNEIKLDGEYRALCLELVHDGKMIISLDGKRLKSITRDLIILCPHCGKPLGETSERVYRFAKMWYWTKEPARIDAFRIYSARSPLTEEGFAGNVQPYCHNCKQSIMAILQMVMV